MIHDLQAHLDESEMIQKTEDFTAFGFCIYDQCLIT